MISLSRVIKGIAAETLEIYDYTKPFPVILPKEDIRAEKSPPFRDEAEEASRNYLEDSVRQSANIFDAAQKRTDAMRQEAEEYSENLRKSAREYSEKLHAETEEEARAIREEARKSGHREGYDAGYEEGLKKALEEHETEMARITGEFQAEVKSVIESVTQEKSRTLDKYIDDLKKLTLTIAEKVIQTSLKSSGEVMKRMIVSAAGKLKKTQWVKIYVSQTDASLMLQGDVGLLNELSHISGNIKIITMDHAEDGSCIIELPEEIIDVGVNTQLENIKGILNNARL